MALKHSFTSGLPSSGDATKVDGPRWDAEHLVDGSDSGGVATGKLRLLAGGMVGKNPFSVRGSSGIPLLMQPSLARAQPVIWQAGGGGAGWYTFGTAINAGSPTSRNTGFDGYFGSTRRIGYQTPATANANVNARQGVDRNYVIASVAKTGGFLSIWRFGTSLYQADGRCFLGLAGYGNAWGTSSPSNLLNVVGVGFDPGDTSWSIFTNDASGVASKQTLSAAFPCNTNNVDMMECGLYVAPGSQTLYWQMTNLTTGAVVTGSTSNDIPIDTMLQMHLNVSNGASGLAVGVDFALAYTETDA